MLRKTLLLAGFLMASLTFANRAEAFAYVFAGETFGVDLVTHVAGYTGVGGHLTITVGINPASVHALDMVISTQNAIRTWNALVPTTGNLVFGAANNIPAGMVHFESTLLHELGHSLGLDHNNVGSQIGIDPGDTDYAMSSRGPNGDFDFDPGADGVIGTHDDVRGDDINLNYFKKDTNNPFEIAGVVDSTTYSRDLADLPAGHLYSAVGSRQVAAVTLGVDPNTEAVMNQGVFLDEAQRTLGHDDVAGIRYAMAGIDRIAGTADDYTFTLVYAGLTTAADIVIGFDNSMASFAASYNSGVFIAANHVRIINEGIFFNDGFDWFFNNQSNAVPEPSAMLLSLMAGGAFWFRRRRQAAGMGTEPSHTTAC